MSRQHCSLCSLTSLKNEEPCLWRHIVFVSEEGCNSVKKNVLHCFVFYDRFTCMAWGMKSLYKKLGK